MDKPVREVSSSSPNTFERSSSMQSLEAYFTILLPPSLSPAIRWLFDEADNKQPWRQKVGHMLHSIPFELGLGAVIFFNIALLIQDVDAYARGETAPTWVTVVQRVLIAFYSLEVIVRFYVARAHLFKDMFCVLDILLVTYDVINQIFFRKETSVSVLRIGRLAKVARTFKFLKTVPELHLMMKGVFGAVKSIFWGSLMALLLIVLWSILAVNIVHPINEEIANETNIYEGCSRCPDAYKSVFESALTIFQTIVAGDAWGTVNVPIIQRSPGTGLFFFAIFASIALATMNLILAVIVDSAQEARRKSLHDLAREKEYDYRRARKRLQELCAQLDTDGSGLLCLEELENGFRSTPEFGNALKVLEIREDDLPILFGIMDQDGSGEVSYEEFVKELWKMQSNDVQSMVINIRFYLTQIRRQILEQVETMGQRVVQRIEKQEQAAEEKMEDMINRKLQRENEIMEEEFHVETKLFQDAVRNGQTGKATTCSNVLPQKDQCAKPDIDLSSPKDIQGVMNNLIALERTCKENLSETLRAINTSVVALSSRMELDRTSDTVSSLTRSMDLPRPESAPVSYLMRAPQTPQANPSSASDSCCLCTQKPSVQIKDIPSIPSDGSTTNSSQRLKQN